MRKIPITEKDIVSKQTANGGWTKEQLAEWGVPWPVPSGWKQEIIRNGIPYSEIIQIFGGGNIVAEHKPLFCKHCDQELISEYDCLEAEHASVKDLGKVLKRRLGSIVKVTWPNGRCYWGCHHCGRQVK